MMTPSLKRFGVLYFWYNPSLSLVLRATLETSRSPGWEIGDPLSDNLLPANGRWRQLRGCPLVVPWSVVLHDRLSP